MRQWINLVEPDKSPDAEIQERSRHVSLASYLNEKRRNPEQNPKESAFDFIAKYKDNPHAYLHTTTVMKVGIYPRTSSSHDSPMGIYAFRIQEIWPTLEWARETKVSLAQALPYWGGPHLFILESDIDTNFLADYTEADLKRDIAKLRQMYRLDDADVQQLLRAARTNQNFCDCPAGYFWGMTKAIVAGTMEFDEYTPVNTRRWSLLLRRLGYVGFNDPGMGLIHGAESAQAVFLTTKAFRVVDHMLTNRRQREVEIGDKRYKGGRLPRDLYMQGIPNTFMYNYDPEAFANVRRWTVGSMDVLDFWRFTKFVPWNGVGIIEHLSIANGANESHSLSEARKFVESKIPSNIKIQTLHVGGRMPTMVLDHMPPDFPVEKIVISPFAFTHGIDRLPEPIRSKIEVQKFP